jgi:hypothetical protein
MKSLSLKMDDKIFEETEKMLIKVRMNRNRYINEAVAFYNLVQKRKLLSRALKQESKLVRESSMEVLKEWERLNDED